MLRVEFDLMAEALVVEGIEDDPAGVVRGVAGPLDGLLPVVSRVAPEISLGDQPVRGPTEGHAHMLQLVDGPRRVPHHDLDGVLVAQVIPSFDRVIEVPFPAVLFLVAQGRRDPSLGGARMGAGRQHLAHHGDVRAGCGLHRRAEAREAGADDQDVMLKRHTSVLSSARHSSSGLAILLGSTIRSNSSSDT